MATFSLVSLISSLLLSFFGIYRLGNLLFKMSLEIWAITQSFHFHKSRNVVKGIKAKSIKLKCAVISFTTMNHCKKKLTLVTEICILYWKNTLTIGGALITISPYQYMRKFFSLREQAYFYLLSPIFTKLHKSAL